jgi:hypothetical protein
MWKTKVRIFIETIFIEAIFKRYDQLLFDEGNENID